MSTLKTSYKPMTPFLAKVLELVYRRTMNRFFKSSVIGKASTVAKLAMVDISYENNLKNYKQIVIGCATNVEVNRLLSEKKVCERSILAFRTDCKNVEKIRKIRKRMKNLW